MYECISYELRAALQTQYALLLIPILVNLTYSLQKLCKFDQNKFGRCSEYPPHNKFVLLVTLHLLSIFTLLCRILHLVEHLCTWKNCSTRIRDTLDLERRQVYEVMELHDVIRLQYGWTRYMLNQMVDVTVLKKWTRYTNTTNLQS